MFNCQSKPIQMRAIFNVQMMNFYLFNGWRMPIKFHENSSFARFEIRYLFDSMNSFKLIQKKKTKKRELNALVFEYSSVEFT